jgi:hypothetical protein
MVSALLQEAPLWLGWLVTLALVSLTTFIAWRAWFADRADGRRRCPRCWYDMAYSEGMTCSECGYTAPNESALARTRRHWGRGFIAILAAAAIIVFVYERSVQVGWTGLLPSRALIWTLPLFSSGNNDAVVQLATRLNQGKLSDRNLQRIIESCTDGDRGARPGSTAWASKYGTILDRFRPVLASRRSGSELYDMERPLLNLPPVITITAREQWPAGASARIAVQALNWWPFGSDTQLRIAPLMDGAEPVTAYFRGLNPPATPFSVLTPPLEADRTSLEVEVATYRRTSQTGDEWQPVSVSRLSVPISIGGELTSMITPVSGRDLDDAIRASIIGLRKWNGGAIPLRFYVNPRQTAISAFDGVAIGYISEILHDGQVVLTDQCWWMGGTGISDIQFGSWSDEGGLKKLAEMDLRAGRWEVRIRSDPTLAIRAGEAPRCWEGQFTIPLSFVQVPGVAPEPHWWMDEEESPETPRPDDDAGADSPDGPSGG